MTQAVKRRYVTSALALDRILALLSKKDYTADALATAVHKGEWMVKNYYLKALEQEGRVHLAKWAVIKVGTANRRRAVYRIGPGERAKRPSPQEVRREKYAEYRKDPDFLPNRAAKERVRTFKPKPDPAAAWLF